MQDNTLYEHPTGSLSNGAGDHMFAGQNGVDRILEVSPASSPDTASGHRRNMRSRSGVRDVFILAGCPRVIAVEAEP
ncbi:hypothetical protein NKDENANG_03012 [Candidatus Entotheonellaceae bacterium PAL068K]